VILPAQGTAIGAAVVSAAMNTLLVGAGTAIGVGSATGAGYALDPNIAVYSTPGSVVTPPYFHLQGDE
jgi:hypothetical protein